MAKGDITIVDGVEYVQTVEDGYEERTKAQLDAWVEGTSNHNTVDEECCPDFSCCNLEVNTPGPVRRRFAQAVAEKDEATTMAMLGGFLGGALSSMGVNAHVAGDGAKFADGEEDDSK